jgi:hypothetical protein
MKLRQCSKQYTSRIELLREKKLDSFADIFYIQSMITMNFLTLHVARKAAWQHMAVAEGGFY